MDTVCKITISDGKGFYHATTMEWRGTDTEFVSFINSKRDFLKGNEGKKEGDLTVSVTVDVDGRNVVTESMAEMTRKEVKNMEQRFFHVGNELVKWADDRDNKKGKK